MESVLATKTDVQQVTRSRSDMLFSSIGENRSLLVSLKNVQTLGVLTEVLSRMIANDFRFSSFDRLGQIPNGIIAHDAEKFSKRIVRVQMELSLPAARAIALLRADGLDPNVYSFDHLSDIGELRLDEYMNRISIDALMDDMTSLAYYYKSIETLINDKEVNQEDFLNTFNSEDRIKIDIGNVRFTNVYEFISTRTLVLNSLKAISESDRKVSIRQLVGYPRDLGEPIEGYKPTQYAVPKALNSKHQHSFIQIENQITGKQYKELKNKINSYRNSNEQHGLALCLQLVRLDPDLDILFRLNRFHATRDKTISFIVSRPEPELRIVS